LQLVDVRVILFLISQACLTVFLSTEMSVRPVRGNGLQIGVRRAFGTLNRLNRQNVY
jgi:hypothetical protein